MIYELYLNKTVNERETMDKTSWLQKDQDLVTEWQALNNC